MMVKTVDTSALPGVLPAGLGQESRREEDGWELRPIQHDLEGGGVGERKRCRVKAAKSQGA